MKKIMSAILLFMLCSFCLFANNSQKTYLSSDYVYKCVDRLCRMNGVLGPTPVSPTTEAELRIALSRLDYSELSSHDKILYDEILKQFSTTPGFSYIDDSLTINPGIKLYPQFYIYNNENDTYYDEFFLQFKDRDKFFMLDTELSIKDNAYLYLEYGIMDNPIGFSYDENSKKQVRGDYFSQHTNFNLFFDKAIDGSYYSIFNNPKEHEHCTMFSHQPMKAGGSFGNEYFNLFIGRSKQSFGGGITGNFVISDNFTYQEFSKLSLSTKVFTYNLSLTHYDNADGLYTKDIAGYKVDTPVNFQLSGMHQNRSIQRLDFALYDKLRLSVNLGAHIYSDSMFDWRMVMPMMLVHNWNNNGNGENEEYEIGNNDEINNIMGFEAEWIVSNNLTLYSQVVIDQFKLPVEKGSSIPSANGFMLGAKIITSVKDVGVFDSWIEAVYTNPYLYLNKKIEKRVVEKVDPSTKEVTFKEEEYINYYLDHIAGYYWVQSNAGELNYLGHSFGPDTIALSLGTNFTSLNNWSLNGEVLYKIHGGKGIDKSYWRQNQDNPKDENLKTPTGVAEHTFEVKLSSNITLSDKLSFNAALLSRYQRNYHNELNVKKYSLQSSFGMKLILL